MGQEILIWFRNPEIVLILKYFLSYLPTVLVRARLF